ncbi:hypothetical protein [Desulfosporosinus sp. BICA1-9]|uniref:hypothetical protein n=1 Tax=Desulfosporosinus sp. BICA1-9 TaxID=1531958 RepID=UPI00054C51C5|nr:hypothetical protein [Desulfosporosinus sp. BICA1-9]KJS47803.1 MAG: hypothetical protein VR66_17640 [Peptococcaceae bacterium BRH_c23]KJS89913.1 MAG: hypothetical protein JL57_04620 [Desulfosporosinus sp. BICA1-9]HBW35088.1 hypothetical protein [Desulfosporosinus sp.]
MRELCRSIFLSFCPPEEPPLSEAERLLAEIEATKEKMNHAWNRFDYAAPEYVEIAVLELLIVETQYGLLNKRYRLLLGVKGESPFYLPSAVKALSYSMASSRLNHAFYGSLSNSTSETPSFDSITPQLVAQNPYQS